MSLLSSVIFTSDGIRVVYESNECYAHGLQLLASSLLLHPVPFKKWVRNGLCSLCARSVWLKLLPAPGDFGDGAGIFGAQHWKQLIHLDLPCSPAKHTRYQLGIRFYFVL